MWPNERTAILVIHGIGQQNTFDTIDGFVRSLHKTLRNLNPRDEITLLHDLVVHDGERYNSISIIRNGEESNAIDIFEYYWAHETEGKIKMKEVFDWLVKVSEGARKFYEQNVDLANKYESENDEAFQKKRDGAVFRRYWYMKYASYVLRLGGALLNARIPVPAVAAAMRTIATIGNFIVPIAKPYIEGYIGDIALYTTTDMKSKHYLVRKAILERATRRLLFIIRRQTPEYQRVIVAGHSLGSVIGYDALNRISQGMNARSIEPDVASKVKGLITFGSPLDKIAFFFRERAEKRQDIKIQMLKNLHSFKTKDWGPATREEYKLDSRFKKHLEHVRWINFWDTKDVVSGPLDFYELREGDNRELKMGFNRVQAHVNYWDYLNMYKQIAETMLSENQPADVEVREEVESKAEEVQSS